MTRIARAAQPCRKRSQEQFFQAAAGQTGLATLGGGGVWIFQTSRRKPFGVTRAPGNTRSRFVAPIVFVTTSPSTCR